MIKKKYLEIIYVCLLYLFVLQYFLQEYIQIFQYFDEFIAILFFPVFIVYVIKKHGKIKVDKKDIIIVLCLLGVIIIGLFSNFLYGYQETKYIVSDIIVFLKFFLVYFLAKIIFTNGLREFNRKISTNIKIITFILFILSILNYIFKFLPFATERFGISSNQLFFGHPTVLAAITAMLMLNLLVFGYKLNKSFYITIAMQMVLIISTLRTKAIAYVIVAIILMIYVLKLRKKIKILNIALLIVLCCIIGYKQIVFYFTQDNTARASLLNTSFEIANDYFPFGTGFATYGSYFSGVNYSPIYEMYGIDNVFGLSQEDPSFMSDSFWPMLLGQFGYIGTILYLICILLIFINIQEKYSLENKNIYLAKILALVYLLISSTSESAFVNPIAIPFAIILAL